MAMGQNPNRAPSEHFNPHQNRLTWVVHLPQNGDPKTVLTHGRMRKGLGRGQVAPAFLATLDEHGVQSCYQESDAITAGSSQNTTCSVYVLCLK